MSSSSRIVIGVVLIVAIYTALWVHKVHSETLHLERVVPPGAVLTYSENGVVMKTLALPPGMTKVTIEMIGAGGPGRPAIRGAAHKRGPQ